MTIWEYQKFYLLPDGSYNTRKELFPFTRKSLEKLNELGKEGWEAFHLEIGFGDSGFYNEAWCKRLVENGR